MNMINNISINDKISCNLKRLNNYDDQSNDSDDYNFNNIKNFLCEKIFITHDSFDNLKYHLEVLTKYIIYYENNDYVLNIYRSENNDPYYLINVIYLSSSNYDDIQYFNDLHQFFLDTSLLEAYEKRIKQIKDIKEYSILYDKKCKELDLLYNKNNNINDNIEIIKKLIIKKESIMLTIFLEEYISLNRDNLERQCIKDLIQLCVDNRCIDEVLLIVSYILYEDGENWYDYDGRKARRYIHKKYIMMDTLLDIIIYTNDIDYIEIIFTKLIKNVGIKEIQHNCDYFNNDHKALFDFCKEQEILTSNNDTW